MFVVAELLTLRGAEPWFSFMGVGGGQKKKIVDGGEKRV